MITGGTGNFHFIPVSKISFNVGLNHSFHYANIVISKVLRVRISGTKVYRTSIRKRLKITSKPKCEESIQRFYIMPIARKALMIEYTLYQSSKS